MFPVCRKHGMEKLNVPFFAYPPFRLARRGGQALAYGSRLNVLPRRFALRLSPFTLRFSRFRQDQVDELNEDERHDYTANAVDQHVIAQNHRRA